MSIAPIVQTIAVKAPPARAFELFVTRMADWWPKGVTIGETPHAEESVTAAAMPNAHRVFAELSRLLGDQPYFVGEALTLADRMVAPQMDFLSETPEWPPLTAERPNLVSWLNRMTSRASFRETTWERLAQPAAA